MENESGYTQSEEAFFEEFKKDFITQVMSSFENKVKDVLESYLIDLGDKSNNKVIFQFEFDKIAKEIDDMAGALILSELNRINDEDDEEQDN